MEKCEKVCSPSGFPKYINKCSRTPAVSHAHPNSALWWQVNDRKHTPQWEWPPPEAPEAVAVVAFFLQLEELHLDVYLEE